VALIFLDTLYIDYTGR